MFLVPQVNGWNTEPKGFVIYDPNMINEVFNASVGSFEDVDYHTYHAVY